MSKTKLRLPGHVKAKIKKEYKIMESNVGAADRNAVSYQIIKARILIENGLDSEKYKWVN